MRATAERPPADQLPPLPRGSLLTAELHRFRARRFIQVLAALGAVVWAVAVVIGLLSFGEPTAADYAAAQAQVDQILEENNQYREDCLEDPEAFVGPGQAAVRDQRQRLDRRLPDGGAHAGSPVMARNAVSRSACTGVSSSR